jgi:hypothetical protein
VKLQYKIGDHKRMLTSYKYVPHAWNLPMPLLQLQCALLPYHLQAITWFFIATCCTHSLVATSAVCCPLGAHTTCFLVLAARRCSFLSPTFIFSFVEGNAGVVAFLSLPFWRHNSEQKE